MTVQTILDSKGHHIVSVTPDATLASAVKLLSERRIGAVLVMSGSHMDGILSERDIVRVIGERGAAALDDKVEAVMTRKVVHCRPNDTVGAIMEKMTTGKFRHLPVIHDDSVVGLISIGDVVDQSRRLSRRPKRRFLTRRNRHRRNTGDDACQTGQRRPAQRLAEKYHADRHADRHAQIGLRRRSDRSQRLHEPKIDHESERGREHR